MALSSPLRLRRTAFYLFLNQNQNSQFPSAMLYAILFDPATGEASARQSLLQASNTVRSLSIDSAAKNLVLSSGQNCGSLWFLQLSPADGTITANNSAFLPCEQFAELLGFDPTSNFLHFQYMGGNDSSTHIFSVATQTETASSPLPANLQSDIGGEADPQAPFSFVSLPASNGGGISVFTVDSTTG